MSINFFKMEFTLKTIIDATAQEIYTAWLSSKGHTAMTVADATITAVVGKKFTAWDGYIAGTTLELIRVKLIFWGVSCYANSFCNLKRKNFTLVTPLKLALKFFIFELNDSAFALVLLFSKKFKILFKWCSNE